MILKILSFNTFTQMVMNITINSSWFALWAILPLRPAQGNEVELFCRLLLKEGQSSLAFVPDRLSDGDMAASQLKRGLAGGIFSDVSQLQTSCAEIAWEVTASYDPPAAIKPIKPKFWLLGNVEIKMDTVYKVK